MNNIYMIFAHHKRKCEILLLLTNIIFYTNIYLSIIRLFIINYYFIGLFKIRPESNLDHSTLSSLPQQERKVLACSL